MASANKRPASVVSDDDDEFMSLAQPTTGLEAGGSLMDEGRPFPITPSCDVSQRMSFMLDMCMEALMKDLANEYLAKYCFDSSSPHFGRTEVVALHNGRLPWGLVQMRAYDIAARVEDFFELKCKRKVRAIVVCFKEDGYFIVKIRGFDGFVLTSNNIFFNV